MDEIERKIEIGRAKRRVRKQIEAGELSGIAANMMYLSALERLDEFMTKYPDYQPSGNLYDSKRDDND